MLAIALITAMIPFRALANATVCYGDLDAVCTPPTDLTVQQGGGKWRVRIVSDERIRWQAYVRNNNTGTLSALSDITP
ncbi:MAG: hypothetical protein Q8L45_01695 [Xanthomonadaceae bacterium]|nr:hypothetical protein [Xanthomonadaceae bacterium]MDP2185026.1 hypothetical protein [Xanthomonadales bacterium]MDZ4114405.1 hypothetical protein [Xanthomonadaceae bacterium]